MQSGIVKVIPPKKWLAEQPALGDIVKDIKAPNPIIQDIMADGNRDGYRILNMQAPRIYNLPQWRKLCERPDHQPPARRGERRAAPDKPTRASGRVKKEAASAAEKTGGAPAAKKRGRPAKRRKTDKGDAEKEDRPPTPTSPSLKPIEKEDVKHEAEEEEAPSKPARGTDSRRGGCGGAQTSVSSRRKNAEKAGGGKINEADFVDFDYKMDISDYTPERCEELERLYWRTLTYASPLYGADMMGSLFDDRTKNWNLGKLPSLLDVLGTQIPGVNTAYLYLGMWKATFAWHLEDVDLHSINYLHFGAPKQWYSISQKDARKFEAAMASIWPVDAKACDQFLRHKTFLISPSTLLNKYGVKVNRITHYPGEFVITFPYGYHSGFNMGYNCAEAVNFALPDWLEMGRIAKKCECEQAQDSVWIDVAQIERKMRGEETEFEETDEEDEGEEEEDGPTDLPTPPESSGDTKVKQPARKRKHKVAGKRGTEADKKVRVRLKTHNEPCCLCPNDIKGQTLLPTDDGRKAHRICAEYTPETDIENGIVYGVSEIKKDRLDLKCIYCRSRKGAKIQCSQKKCVRSYHATCTAAAGMFVEQGETPVFGEDGTEYKTTGCEFSCRFHRAKRDKNLTTKLLEADERVHRAASMLKQHEICQFQFLKKDICAGIVLQNRKSEATLFLEILPSGEKFEVEYKCLLLGDPSDYHLDKPSDKALPLPKSRRAKDALNTTSRHADDLPRKDDPFVEGKTWAEFVTFGLPKNFEQVNVDFTKAKQILFYIGEISKESTAYYTADLNNRVNDPTVNFLNTLPKPAMLPRPQYSTNYSRPAPAQRPVYNQPKPAPRPAILPPGYSHSTSQKSDKPYEYKPRTETYRGTGLTASSMLPFPTTYGQNSNQRVPYAFGTDLKWSNPQPRNSYGVPSQQSSLSYPSSYSYEQASRPPYKSSSSHSQSMGQSSGHANRLSGNYSNQYSSSSKSDSLHSTTAHSRAPQKPTHKKQPSRSFDFNRIFEKYPYLKKENNRNPGSYKSPYRQDGLGFCNGYEGDFKAHMAAQMKKDPNYLLKTPRTTVRPLNQISPTYSQTSSTPAPAPAYEPPSKTYAPILPPPRRQFGSAAPSPVNVSAFSNPASMAQCTPVTRQSATKPPSSWQKKPAGLHPAIRANYANGLAQYNYRPQTQASNQQQPARMSDSPISLPPLNSRPTSQQGYHQPQQSLNSYSSQPHLGAHNMDWNSQYQQKSPMTPQQSPAQQQQQYSSRPSSSHNTTPAQSAYMSTPAALATPTPAAPVSAEQRKFLQDCTPPARSFYSQEYRVVGAPLSQILGAPDEQEKKRITPPYEPTGNGEQQNGNKNNCSQQQQQSQQTQSYQQQFARPISQSKQPPQLQPTTGNVMRPAAQKVVDVPDLGPDSTGMMKQLFENIRNLASQT